MKQANLNCHGKSIERKAFYFLLIFFFQGGFYGCEHAVTDVRCRLTAAEFYGGKTYGSSGEILLINRYLFLSIIFIWYWWN